MPVHFDLSVRRCGLTALAAAAVVVMSVPAQAQPPQYSIVELAGVPVRLNDSGQIAGWISGGSTAHAAIYRNGSWVDLGVAGLEGSAAYAINASGAVAGYAYTATSTRAVSAPAGSSSIALLGSIGADAAIYGINSANLMVGCQNNPGSLFPDPNRAFRYSGTTLTEFHALLGAEDPSDQSCARDVNDAGDVVGEVQSSGVQRGFLHRNPYSSSTVTLLVDGTNYLSSAMAINGNIAENGTIVGEGVLGGWPFFQALSYDVATGAISSLGATEAGASSSVANDVNDSGDAVGSMVIGPDRRAFLSSGGQAYDLNDLIPAGTGWVLEEAYSINNAGQIVGRGYVSSPLTTRYFLLNPPATPESRIEVLITDVNAIQTSGGLSAGNASALVAKLDGAIQQLERGNVGAAVNKIEAFVNQVDAFVRSRKLTAAAGQPLIAEANDIIADLTS